MAAMYDVPVTFSIRAPSAELATAFVTDWIKQYPHNAPDVYEGYGHGPRDHAFVDGDTRLCDCVGH